MTINIPEMCYCNYNYILHVTFVNFFFLNTLPLKGSNFNLKFFLLAGI